MTDDRTVFPQDSGVRAKPSESDVVVSARYLKINEFTESRFDLGPDSDRAITLSIVCPSRHEYAGRFSFGESVFEVVNVMRCFSPNFRSKNFRSSSTRSL